MFSEFKRLIVGNFFDELSIFIKSISQKDLAIILSNVLMSFYNDRNFYNNSKNFFLGEENGLDDFYKIYFNLFYLLSEDSCKENIIFLFNEKIEPSLFFKLLSGGLRNKNEIIKEVCLENIIDDSYKEVLRYYFLSKKMNFREIDEMFGKDFSKKSLKYSKEKIKVALLISGQVRGMKPAIKSWVDTLGLNDHSVDVFFSTWKKSGIPQKNDFSRVGSDEVKSKVNDLTRKLSDIKMQDLMSNYLPPLNITKEYLKEEISCFLGFNDISINIEDEALFSKYTNSMKLYYKIHNCFEMSKEKGNYDLYIRVRPDLILSNIEIDLLGIYNELCLNPKIYCSYGYSYEYYGFGVDDKFAISKYDYMQTYSNTWLYDSASNTRMIGHTNLANNLFYHKIDVDKFDNIRTFFSNYNIIGDDL